MLPGFSAERSLRSAHRLYRAASAAPVHAEVAALAAPQGAVAVSGVYDGTYCLGGVLTVVTVDLDEHGNVIYWHPADEIGSC
jgi:hypothetical protein